MVKLWTEKSFVRRACSFQNKNKTKQKPQNNNDILETTQSEQPVGEKKQDVSKWDLVGSAWEKKSSAPAR